MIDCSTIHIMKNEQLDDEDKIIIRDNNRYLLGFYEGSSDNIFLYGNLIKCRNIVSLLSHEVLHKILFHKIGIDACEGLDVYLKYDGIYKKIDNGGI